MSISVIEYVRLCRNFDSHVGEFLNVLQRPLKKTYEFSYLYLVFCCCDRPGRKKDVGWSCCSGRQQSHRLCDRVRKTSPQAPLLS